MQKLKNRSCVSPKNDDFDSAKAINALGYDDIITTAYATVAVGDSIIGSCDITGAGMATVWYKYTPDSDTAISIDTPDSDYDTFIAVWAKPADELVLVACNNNGTGQAVLALQVERGTTYYIEIGQP